jgi:hypothetical protein
MNRLAILMALPLIGACDSQSQDRNHGGADISINSDDSGQESFNLSIGQGRVNIGGLKLDGEDFDIDGVKLMPGSSLTAFNIDSRGKGATVNLAFKAPKPPDQVRAYFVDKFRAKGVQARLSGDKVVGTSKDGDPFAIEVAAAPGGSKGTIVVHSND